MKIIFVDVTTETILHSLKLTSPRTMKSAQKYYEMEKQERGGNIRRIIMGNGELRILLPDEQLPSWKDWIEAQVLPGAKDDGSGIYQN